MKDPAFLFYSADFYLGTFEMTDAQVGQYIRLLCLQHQKGHLSEAVMLTVMKGKPDALVMSKFIRDIDGTYYNEKLEHEATRRAEYSRSRSANRTKSAAIPREVSVACDDHMSNTCETCVEHMETETIYIPPLRKNPVVRDGGTGEGKVGKCPIAVQSKSKKTTYGEYENVRLTDDEFEKLKDEYPTTWQALIDRLSGYIASKGDKYKSHYATIKNWARKDEQDGRVQRGGPAADGGESDSEKRWAFLNIEMV